MPEYSLWLCREFPRCPPVFPDGFHRKQSAASLSACAEPPDAKSGTMLPEAAAQGNFLIVGKVGAEGGIRTHTPCGATPSRWCVCQFRHFRTGRVTRGF